MKYVACGTTFTLAVTREGAVYSWGRGSNGELGRGRDITQVYTPERVEVCAVRLIDTLEACCVWHHLCFHVITTCHERFMGLLGA